MRCTPTARRAAQYDYFDLYSGMDLTKTELALK
jgi:hypothetical protein